MYIPPVQTLPEPVVTVPNITLPEARLPAIPELDLVVPNYACEAELSISEQPHGVNKAMIALTYLSDEEIDVSYSITATVGNERIFYDHGTETLTVTDDIQYQPFLGESTQRQYIGIPATYIEDVIFPIYYGDTVTVTASVNGYDCTSKILSVKNPLSCEVSAVDAGDHADLSLSVTADLYSSSSVLVDAPYTITPYEEGAVESYDIQGGSIDIVDGTHTYDIGDFVYTEEHSNTILFDVSIPGYKGYDCGTVEVTRSAIRSGYYDSLIDAIMGGSAEILVPATPGISEIPDWIVTIPEGFIPDAEGDVDDDPIGEGVIPAEEDTDLAAPAMEGDAIPDVEEGIVEDEAPAGGSGSSGSSGSLAGEAVEEEIEITPELVEEILASPEAEGVDLTDREEVESLVTSYIEKLKEERAAARLAEEEAATAVAAATQQQTEENTPVWVYVLYGALPVLLIILAVVILMKKPKSLDSEVPPVE